MLNLASSYNLRISQKNPNFLILLFAEVLSNAERMTFRELLRPHSSKPTNMTRLTLTMTQGTIRIQLSFSFFFCCFLVGNYKTTSTDTDSPIQLLVFYTLVVIHCSLSDNFKAEEKEKELTHISRCHVKTLVLREVIILLFMKETFQG